MSAVENIVLFENNGTVKFAYKKDGTPIKFDQLQLFAAAQQYLDVGKVPFVIGSENNSKIAFQETNNNEIILYVTNQIYRDSEILHILRAQAIMYNAFYGSFVRPLHVHGLDIQTVFGVPKVNHHRQHPNLPNFLQQFHDLGTDLIAFYCQNEIVEASDSYWQQNRDDLLAIDLLVRHNEAPYTDQVFRRSDGIVSRVSVAQLQNTLKFVAVGNVNLSQAVSKVPAILRANQQFLQLLYPRDPQVFKEVLAWVIDDRETPRCFGNIPPQLEREFIDLIVQNHDTIEKNRIKDVTLVCRDYKFFYMPMVLVRQTSFFSGHAHLWSFYCLHNLPGDVDEMRDFAERIMREMVPLLKPLPQQPPPKK
ncbi:hypothetical protein TVAG_343250 [Trichomonas vaginalis G3]|uniref:Uncharacterized protein n=1 Tax=Trichomonas vaginalis (strain ATCC PRA-98 / G3) TaxID=412133 RepID=A2E1C9_TRIV3|nr:hypothetical protein TVAGG3_0320260 [Trichomonas vaginalis G3]EAY13496.1 hypothetical protein TVAG_343250 [Trichomonas vaginalis G3]KAI5529240.1 hypothetical protein TVAGG3_0320260 [Trichomonas vaginalis G3]|eukprot:XP_001325719.1 hypothetical protein [Trichomonas vaginalis G3]